MQAHMHSRALRIAFVTESFLPELNGVAMTAGRLLTGLEAAGCQVHLIRPRQPGERDGQPLSQSQAPLTLTHGMGLPGYKEIRFGLPASARLRKLWQANRPDVVHIVTEGPLGYSALQVASRLGLPIAGGYHTHFARCLQHYRSAWLSRPISRYLLHFHNRCHINLVPTLELAQELEAEGMRNNRVLSRGVDKTLFNPTWRSNELRQQWGASAQDLVMLSVGRLAAEKNLDLAVQAWQRARVQQPGIKLVMVGDGPERERLAQQNPDIIFTGRIPAHELGAYYASADIFLFAGMADAFANVVQEALACGLAVISFDYACSHELIEHGRNGILVPFGDAQAFLRASSDLVQQPARVRKLGQAARHAGKSWQSVIDDLLHAYQEAIAMNDSKGTTAPAASQTQGYA